VSLSHAQAGEIWLRKYLEKLDKTEENLAAELWEKTWTAIAEVYIFHNLTKSSAVDYHSFATTPLRNMSWDIHRRRRVYTCTVLMFALESSTRCQRK